MNEYNLDQMKVELSLAADAPKDIVIIVHDQLPYVEHCVNSIRANTEDYNLYLWDNGSMEPTASYLRSLEKEPNVFLHREEQNLGFIIPNNRLIERTSSPYIILLNSDVRVYKDWDRVMIGWLQAHSNVSQVGYLGGYLDENGKGIKFGRGPEVQYICGFCSCIRRATYEKYGLFDEEHLKFAYCEDSDFSLRLRESGDEIYALHLDLVHHYENVTIKQVLREVDKTNILKDLAQNSAYMKARWGSQLKLRPHSALQQGNLGL